MSALGRLVASVVLDTAEFTVGTDKAKYLAAQAATSINRSMSDMESSIKSNLAGIAAAFAAGFGVAALKKAFDDVVESASRLNDISKSTGTAVETLSKIAQGAKLAGKSIDDVAPAIQKMIAGLKGLEPESAAAGQALQYLGISTTDANGKLKSGGDLYLEVAKKMETLEDGAGKVRLAQALMGKVGAEQLPIMEKLAAAGDLVAKVTAKQAEQAEQYQENLVRLGAAKGALIKTIAMELLPVADAFVRTLLKMQSETSGVKDKVGELAKDGSIRAFAEDAVGALGFVMNAGDGVVRVFQMAGEMIALTLAKATNNTIAAGQALLALATNNPLGAGMALNDADEKNASLTQQAAIRMREIIEKPLAGDNFVAGFREQLARADTALKTGKKSADDFAGALGKAVKPEKDLGDAIAHVTAELEHRIKLAKIANAEAEEAIKLDEKQRLAVEATAGAFRESVEQLEFEVTLMGKSNAEREIAIRLRALEKAGIDTNTEAVAAYSDRIRSAYASRDAMNSMINAQQEQAALWGQISERATGFFTDLILNGKSAFDNLRQNLKQFLAEMIVVFAKQWILNIAAGGSVTASAAASAAGGAGSYLSGASTLASGASIIGTGLGQTGVAQFYGGLTGAIQGPGLTGAAGMGQAVAPYMGVIMYAAIAVAGALIASGQYDRGWKIDSGGTGQDYRSNNPLAPTFMGTQMDRTYRALGINDEWSAILSGSSMVARMFGRRARQNDAYGIAGEVSPTGVNGENWQDWSRQGGWFSSTQRGTDRSPFSAEQNASFTQALAGIGAVVTSLAKTLGVDGQSAVAGYSKKFDMQLNENGTPLTDEELAKKFGDFFGAVLQDQVALVFDAGGESKIAAYVRQLKGSGEEIGQVIQSIISIVDIASRNPLDDVANAIEASQKQFETAMKANAAAMREAITAYDGSAASTNNLATATVTYYNSQLQLIAAITQISQQVNAMFDSTFLNIKMAGLDKQGKYDYYQADAESARRELATATDPEIIRQLTARINADINAAFGLLSPEDQKAMSAAFIEQGKQAQKEANDRMEKIKKETAEETKKTLKEIKDLLGGNAEDLKKAGADIKEGGNAILQAADQGTVVTVRIVDQNGAPIVNGG